MHIDLSGKVAIVTGGGRGIGREIATALAGEGVTTVVTDLRPDSLADLAREFAARGWKGAQHRCDVRDAARITEVVQGVVQAFGRIDILVNNAGVAPGAPVEEMSEEVCYAPGMIPTEMNRFAEAPPERQRRLLDTLTLRQWGEPRDVASLVCFLASDHARYITGTMVDVSGGKLATQIPRLAWEAAAAAGEVALE